MPTTEAPTELERLQRTVDELTPRLTVTEARHEVGTLHLVPFHHPHPVTGLPWA